MLPYYTRYIYTTNRFRHMHNAAVHMLRANFPLLPTSALVILDQQAGSYAYVGLHMHMHQ